MNTSTSGKTKLSCRWHRWWISFLSEEELPTGVRKNRHVSQCHDCQRHYQTWWQLNEDLQGPRPEEDEWACEAIMAHIRTQEEVPSKVIKPIPGRSAAGTRPWVWAGAVCSLILISLVTYWSMNSDPEAGGIAAPVPRPVEKKQPNPENESPPRENENNPLMMLAALHKEQGLIASDLDKLKTMLNQRVIIFRED